MPAAISSGSFGIIVLLLQQSKLAWSVGLHLQPRVDLCYANETRSRARFHCALAVRWHMFSVILLLLQRSMVLKELRRVGAIGFE